MAKEPPPRHRFTVDFLDALKQGQHQYASADPLIVAKDLLLKVVFCGDSQCGKSAFLSYWMNPQLFNWDTYLPTIGVDLVTTSRSCRSYSPAENNIHLQLWDLSGLPRFQSVVRGCFRLSSVIVFCYSVEAVVNQGKSLQELIRHWARDVAAYAEGGRIPVPVLCGMQCDRVTAVPASWGHPSNRVEETGGPTPTQIDWESFNREMELSAEAILAGAGCRCYAPVKGFITSAKKYLSLDEVLDYIVRRCLGLVQEGTSMGVGRSGAVRLPSLGLPTETQKEQEHGARTRCLT
jgi:hypothetical protein